MCVVVAGHVQKEFYLFFTFALWEANVNFKDIDVKNLGFIKEGEV